MVKNEWYTERMSEQVKAEEGRGEERDRPRGGTHSYTSVSRDGGRESEYAPRMWVCVAVGGAKKQGLKNERSVCLIQQGTTKCTARVAHCREWMLRQSQPAGRKPERIHGTA